LQGYVQLPNEDMMGVPICDELIDQHDQTPLITSAGHDERLNKWSIFGG
jgi:hypothetical protein